MSTDPAPTFDLTFPPLVLLVVPDWDQGRLLRSRLAMQGFDAFIALTPDDAMELMQIHACDIVMVDLPTFGMEGLRLFDRIRGLGGNIGLVALGLDSSRDDRTVDARLPLHPEASVLGLTLAATLALRERRNVALSA